VNPFQAATGACSRNPIARIRDGATLPGVRQRFASMSLFSRVFATNAAVLALATAVLVFGPFTVSVPVARTELLVLLGGLVGMLVLNLVLLRPASEPLHVVAETMRRLDPLEPGQRVPIVGDPRWRRSRKRSTRCSSALSVSAARVHDKR
jgi:hypothetical protein